MKKLEDIIWGDEGFDEDGDPGVEPAMIHVNCMMICCTSTCKEDLPDVYSIMKQNTCYFLECQIKYVNRNVRGTGEFLWQISYSLFSME